MWFFMSVCAVLVFIFFMALLYVRVKDTQAGHIAQTALAEQAGREAVSVLQNNTQLQMAAFRYGEQQGQFAMKVLDLFEQGKWNGDTQQLLDACSRQLNGIAPPRDAPTMVVRAPEARMPDFTAARYYEKGQL